MAIRTARIVAALAASVALTSCQPPTFTLVVSGTIHALSVSARDDGMWPFGWGMDGIYAENVTITEGDSAIWGMTRQPVFGAECGTQDQHDPFPFVITRPPPCWQQSRPAADINPGVIYELSADGLREGHGYFRIEDGRPVNLDWEGNPVE